MATKLTRLKEEKPPEQEKPLQQTTLWPFFAIAIFYAFAEGTFSNWALIYLHEVRRIRLSQASRALSVFWAALAGGRFLLIGLLLKLKGEWVWLVLPLLMMGAFLLLPLVRSDPAGVAVFGFVGLDCSGFFPLTVGLASKRYPANTAISSSW